MIGGAHSRIGLLVCLKHFRRDDIDHRRRIKGNLRRGYPIILTDELNPSAANDKQATVNTLFFPRTTRIALRLTPLLGHQIQPISVIWQHACQI